MPTLQELTDLRSDPDIAGLPAGWFDSYYWTSDAIGPGWYKVIRPSSGDISYDEDYMDSYNAAVVISTPVTPITVDLAAPNLLSPNLANHGVLTTQNGIVINAASNLTLNFNEIVLPGTGNVLLKKVSDDSTVASIDISDSSQVSITGRTLTLNPSSNLEKQTAYYLEMPHGVLTDLVGNEFAGINDRTTFQFTTSNMPDNILFPVVATHGSANGLVFGFLDKNGNGTADPYDWSNPTNYDGMTWAELNSLDQSASGWRAATPQELEDLIADPSLPDLPPGWANGGYITPIISSYYGGTHEVLNIPNGGYGEGNFELSGYAAIVWLG